jgi:hypothetical protein
MADVNIKASITVDTGNTESKVQGVQTGMEKAGKTIQDTGTKTKETSNNFGKLKDSLGNLPGPVGSVVSAFDGLKKAFVAIIMNPVGLVLAAIVATLGLLYAAFTNTFAGGQKVEEIFAGIKATAQSLLDNLDKVGSAIKNVFTFNFSAAKKDLQDIGDAAVNAYGKMADLTAKQQALKMEMLQNDLEGAERQKKLAILREQASDETIPAAKRKAALLALRKDAEDNAKADIKLAKDYAENQIAQLELAEDGAKKNAEAINKIKIEQINVETDNANELRRIAKQITAIEKEEQQKRAENAKKLADELKQIEEGKEKARQEGFKFDMLVLDRREKMAKQAIEDAKKQAEDEDAELAKMFALEELDAKRKLDLKDKKITKDKEDAASVVALENEKRNALNLTGQALNAVGEILGKQTAAGKALGTATALINTFLGITEVLRNKTVIPEPFGTIQKIASVTALAAAGFSAVKGIMRTQVPGGGGGGGSVPAMSTPLNPALNMQGTQLNAASIAGIGNAAAGGINRAYVLEADINNSTERQFRLQRAARLG